MRGVLFCNAEAGPQTTLGSALGARASEVMSGQHRASSSLLKRLLLVQAGSGMHKVCPSLATASCRSWTVTIGMQAFTSGSTGFPVAAGH